MGDGTRVLVTGVGAICGAGKGPEEIWQTLRDGRSVFAPITQWDSSGCPSPLAAEITDFDPRVLLEDRKVRKLTQRGDILGLYAAARAIEGAALIAHRERLDPPAAEIFNDRTAVYVGSAGGAYQLVYDFFPLLTAAAGDVRTFGSELNSSVNPMWLLRALPNNVLCHIGMRYGFKGPNACGINHGASGALAIVEAGAALRAGEADRAVVIGQHAGIEPQASLYYSTAGLLAVDALRPFDVARDGSLPGEGAAALVLEVEAAARPRDATVLGEFLGGGCVSEGEGFLSVRPDGDGPARAIALALEDAGIRAADVGMIVAHGNGNRQSDASEAAAIGRVFGAAGPPVTAFKWAFGDLTAAAGVIDAVLALISLHHGEVPGIATLREVDPACSHLQLSAAPQVARSDVALVLSRGFGGMNAALLFRVRADKLTPRTSGS
jgi:3-oxoacyl-[acyl-carrier-protein] synthase-1